MKEYEEFLDLPTMRWPALGQANYAVRLGALYVGSFVLVSLPVSMETYNIQEYPVQAVLAASAGSMAFVTIAVLR